MLALVGSSPVTSPGGQVIQRNGITFDDIKHLQGQVRRAWTAAGLMALGLIVVGIGFLKGLRGSVWVRWRPKSAFDA